MAMSCLLLLLRRDIPQDPMLAKLLAEITTKSHPATRTLAQRCRKFLVQYFLLVFTLYSQGPCKVACIRKNKVIFIKGRGSMADRMEKSFAARTEVRKC